MSLPLVAFIHIEKPERRIRLWLPLFLLWVLLAPLFVFVLPLVVVGCLVFRLNPFEAIGVVFNIIAALSGTSIQVAHGSALVSIHVV